MKAVIIEDETLAYHSLTSSLRKIVKHIFIYPQLTSVKAAEEFFNQNPVVDLIFSDIHLTDGTSFEILKQFPVKVPVIFITGFDKYYVQAFENNGIDYLLKPFDDEKLNNAIAKYNSLKTFFNISTEGFINANSNNNHSFREFIIIKRGTTDFQVLAAKNIACIYSDNKIAFAVDNQGKKYLCEEPSLSVIINQLDEKHFFRVSRSHIINVDFVDKFYSDQQSRTILQLTIPFEEIVISRVHSHMFKKWIGLKL